MRLFLLKAARDVLLLRLELLLEHLDVSAHELTTIFADRRAHTLLLVHTRLVQVLAYPCCDFGKEQTVLFFSGVPNLLGEGVYGLFLIVKTGSSEQADLLL